MVAAGREIECLESPEVLLEKAFMSIVLRSASSWEEYTTPWNGRHRNCISVSFVVSRAPEECSASSEVI